MMKVLAVIPARYGSTRFEGKPLADILGKPMIQRVYEGVRQSKLVDRIIVATDDMKIVKAVGQFGGEAMMTSPNHPTGSDRIAEVARRVKSEVVVNVQGDEPLLTGTTIDRAIRPILKDPAIPLSTLMTKLNDARDWVNPNVVKVVVDQRGFALYFSRAPIPFPRDLHLGKRLTFPSKSPSPLPDRVFKHIGVYVYRRPFLLRYTRMKPTPLERLEKLEQLRVLENGYSIKISIVDYEPLSVDTPEDLQKLVLHLSKKG